MRLIKYVALFFILLLPVASAQGIKVLYFFNTPNVLAQDIQNQIKATKDFWAGKVDWQEFDYQNESQKILFDKYNIFSLPVAIVDCYGKMERVNRSPTFGLDLNQTVYKCTLPSPIVTESTTMTTVIGEVQYQMNSANTTYVGNYGILIIIILAVSLVAAVFRLRHNKTCRNQERRPIRR